MKIRQLLAATALGSASIAACAVPVQWGANGHWYEYVARPVTAPDAFTAAAASTHLSMTGYLVTITSEAENNFVSQVVAQGALIWLGASDNGAPVNQWTWRVGPEAGQALTYTNWQTGEPNDCCGGENYLQSNWLTLGAWNDHGGPGNAAQENGFVIEYSAAVPEPSTYALFALGLLGLAVASRQRRV